MAVNHERRAQRRLKPDRRLDVDYPELRPRLRDITLDGAYIEDIRPLPRGRMLNLTLWLNKEAPVTVRAMVRRSDEGVGMGVEFLAMSDEDRKRLRNFVGTSSPVGRLQSL